MMRYRVNLCLALVLATQWAQAAEQGLHPVLEKREAPLFELKDSNGRIHRLADYRGRVVVLNFWATWCPPCRQEMPSMERAQKALSDNEVAFLAIDVGEDEDTVFAFTADYPVTFPLLMDTASKVIQSYPVTGLPTTFVLDQDGRMVYRAVGSRDWDLPAIMQPMKELSQKLRKK